MIHEAGLPAVPTADWASADREARRAAALVAAFVGVPSAVAAGAVLAVFALAWLVLLAPVAAAVLTWVAWRYATPEPPRGKAARAG